MPIVKHHQAKFKEIVGKEEAKKEEWIIIKKSSLVLFQWHIRVHSHIGPVGELAVF